MNWSKGLFRVWIVLSGLWLAFITIIGFEDIKSPHYPGRVYLAAENALPSFKRFSKEDEAFSKAESDGKLHSYEIDGVPNTVIYILADVPAAEVKRRLQKVAPIALQDRDAYVWERRQTVAPGLVLAALLPPLGALGLGGATLWAIRGFRQSAEGDIGT